MLLVNGFRPVQKNFNNPNNQKHPILKSQNDSVNFSARLRAVTPAFEVEQLVAKFIPNPPYIGVLGIGAKMHIERAKAYLEKFGIKIKHEPLASLETTVSSNNSTGKLRNATKATLVDLTGKPILSADKTELTVADVTENAANMQIFDKISQGLWGIKDGHQNIALPDEINTVLIRMNTDLTEFRQKWLEIDFDNTNAKAESLQWAYNQLLPDNPRF